MKISLWLSLFCFFLISCKDEPHPCEGYSQTAEYNTLKDDTILIPYKEYDTLFFEIRDADSSIIDTFPFIVSKKTYYVTKVPSTKCAVDPKGEGFEIVLKSLSWSENIKVNYVAYKTHSQIIIPYQDYNYEIPTGALISGIGFPYPSINLAGNTYYDVNKASETNYPPSDPERDILLINRNYGILYFRLPNSYIFTLVQK